MKISVCIKQVPDVAAPFRIRDRKLVFDTGRTVLNAYDASAVEAALVLKEAHGGTVEVVTVAPKDAAETIRKALAMGADQAVHLEIEDGAEYDSRAYAHALAAYFQEADYDIIACGKQSQDTDAGLTGAMLAELLDLPYATNAVDLAWEDDALVVERQSDVGSEIIELPTPCLVTCSNDMNDPRIPNLKGIMQAKRKPVEARPAEGLSKEQALQTAVEGYEPMPEREPGTILDGEPDEMARQLAERLKEANIL